MGKLNIAHHKSYHPYRLDNIERVRRDEAAAQRKQTDDADRALVADAESRLSTLRARAGITPQSPPQNRTDMDVESSTPVPSGSTIRIGDGHINLFADLEEHAAALAARASKSRPAMTDLDCGLPLAPAKRDLQPWYSATRNSADDDKIAQARRQRDLARQLKDDPLSSIPSHLKQPAHALRSPQPHSHPEAPRSIQHPPSASRERRLARESVERARALGLLRRKQRERESEGSSTMTPSTVHGGNGPGYVDVFNRREVEDAHRERDRSWRQRHWEDDRHRRRR
ncbi:hypothetical protein F5148DRAFT_365336 [Russula earlei]|uniref:Uncharacterized protein n=1 Tax=Russula earlei TaxID=71964 RepID=A0ACC0U2G1_9AGAM|nr:hypothetical protein F5148DRAFT_365336 [Russula earlei]